MPAIQGTPAPRAVTPGDPASILLTTDRLYFGLGATASDASGLNLLYMDGYQRSPSGAVVWGLPDHVRGSELHSMLSRLEQQLRSMGSSLARVYVEDPVPSDLLPVFADRGYEGRVELALLAPTAIVSATAGTPAGRHLVRVATDDLWQQKLSLHGEQRHQPDGHEATAEDWVGLERRKCDAGGMDCYLVLDGDEPVAAVGLVCSRDVARLKNLFVRPAFRRRGVGVSAIQLLASRAAEMGYPHFGTFAVKGGAALGMYTKTGLRPVHSATEFSMIIS